MPLDYRAQSNRLVRRSLPWLIATVPWVLAWPVLHWQADQALHTQARQAAREATLQIDRMLDGVANAAQQVLLLAGIPCTEAQVALRDAVTRGPFVRSVNLVYDGKLYCSSLFGSFSEPVNAYDYTAGRLWLMPGNLVTPDHPLLVYRQAIGQRSALAAVDGDHLRAALRVARPDQSQVLRVGSHWLDAQGQVHSGPLPRVGEVGVTLYSSRYPLSLHGGFADGAVWALTRQRYASLLVWLVVLGGLAGLACAWLLDRQHSPRRELQRALDAEEFEAFFQPVVNGSQLRWVGAEVLMRWRHPRAGLVPAHRFIPLAEKSGLIVPMTRLIMRQAARHLAGCARAETPLHIGFNITVRHCEAPGLLEDCQAFLDAFPAGSVKLVLELTERELIEPVPQTQQLFADLRAIGVLIAIDDFGTGHSSLGYLQEFNVDILKIDQSFVAVIGGPDASGHILDSIIELSSKLGLQVVAEGVETPEQRDYLVAREVDFLQGYLFGKPLPAAAFIDGLSRDDQADDCRVSLNDRQKKARDGGERAV